MESGELKAIIESLIFVSEEPITQRRLIEILAEAQVTKDDILASIEMIKNETNNNPSRGLMLVEVAGGYQFRTKQTYATWIQKLNVAKPIKLSQAAIETLSIIAYRQPIIRSEIESIRGVDVGGVLKTLLERNLIRIIGRKDEAGQPLIYGTTQDFLQLFGLKSLNELPPLTEIEELTNKHNEADSFHRLSLVNKGNEESTEIIEEENEEEEEEDEEEETEVIKREEDEDELLLKDIEINLKNLKSLEKKIFKQKDNEKEMQSEDIAGNEKPDDTADTAPKDNSPGL